MWLDSLENSMSIITEFIGYKRGKTLWIELPHVKLQTK